MNLLGGFLLMLVLLSTYGAGFWRGWTVGRDHAEHNLEQLKGEVSCRS